MDFKRVVVFGSLLAGAPAWAQDVGASMWVTEATDSVRFVGTAIPGPAFPENAEVVVLFVEGASVRIMQGDTYGWVEASALTADRPEGAVPAASGSPFQFTPPVPLGGN